jgi:acetate kinase
MNILVLNAGSGSLKFCLYDLERPRPLTEPQPVIATGEIERVGVPGAQLKLTLGEQKQSVPSNAPDVVGAAEGALRHLLDPQRNGGHAVTVDAVGHRMVHGGARFVQPVRIDDAVLEELRRLTALAPLHLPGGVAGIEAAQRVLPDAPNVAVFDTAFHHDLPPVAAHYALPRDLAAQHHLRRYGFHGISYSYVTERLLTALGRPAEGTRLILCHLGGGASVCAVQDGRSVDTSMGFTPLEGLIMGTRSGDIDAGLVLYLIRELHMSTDDVDKLLNKESGLLGLSGGCSNDTRDLEEAEAKGDTSASEALEAFAYRIRKYIGAYAAAMGSVDALAFTDKIGTHRAALRARICQGLELLGLGLDEGRNVDVTGSDPVAIGAGDGRRVWVAPTDEERQVARETYTLLQEIH